MQDDSPKKLSPVFFAFALFCFMLPFATISCPGGRVTVSGYELAVGTEIKGEKMHGELLALIALLFAVVGLAMSFGKAKGALIGGGMAGSAGAILLLILQVKVSNDVASESGGMATVSYDIGYWLTVIALAGGAAYSFYLESQLKRPEDEGAAKDTAAPDATPSVDGEAEGDRLGGP